jgi:putative protease
MAQQLTDIPIHGDYPLNIYNNIALQFFAEHELTSLTLSPELNFSQIEELTARYKLDLECLVHGAVTLMVTEYCAMGSYLGELHAGFCKQACRQGEYWLKDRKNEIFPVVTDQFCRMHVLNAKVLSMLPHVTKFGRIGVARLRIEGKNSTPVEVGEITRLYRELLDQGDQHMLIVQDKVRTIEGEDITRGHYFRGVL